jgi:hypothetical protein
MKISTLALSLLAGIGAGCTTAPSTNLVATAALPDCFDANYDAQRNLFTMKNTAQEPVNQQCMLTVGPRTRISAGSYEVSLANGGGGGAGGTQQRGSGMGGGAGGGGAGARESVTRVDLAEGNYRLTIGAGGPGGQACVFAPYYMSGGPGWAGSPSNIVRIPTGEVIAGIPGADSYARPSRAQHDQSSGLMDGHGGSGPGQASGGHGGQAQDATGSSNPAESGESRRSRVTGSIGAGGIPGGNEDLSTAGGGGGATSRADGGGGGGENPGQPNRPAERGTLGSGGGGGEGSRFECDAGARGGHGFIALRAR